MVTVAEVLQLPLLRGAKLVAGRRGIDAEVRWCHVSEVLDIARLLSGGELLLTTGLTLDVPPQWQQAYIRELKSAGAVGLMLELGRQFSAVPPTLITTAEEVGLPLIAAPYDTPYVKLTEAVYTLLFQKRQAELGRVSTAGRQESRAVQVMENLLAGRILTAAQLVQEMQQLGLRVPESPWLAVLVAEASAEQSLIKLTGSAADGHLPWLLRCVAAEAQLVVFGAEPDGLGQLLSQFARDLAPKPAGVGQAYQEPQQVLQSLEEARQTMLLRRRCPGLDPLFANTGVYRLVLGAAGPDLEQFVDSCLGPLLYYDRVQHTDLCHTLRVLLDDGLAIAEAARHLHVTRQTVYYRLNRISELLGKDLNDVEVRLALAVAMRILDVQQAKQSAKPG